MSSKTKEKPTREKTQKGNGMLLPRGYMSWSALQLWEKNSERYIAKYIYGQDTDLSRNKGIKFGKVVAERLEKGENSGDEIIEMLSHIIPKYDKMEESIEAELDGIRLVGSMDTYQSTGRLQHSFREYKTGRRNPKYADPWNAEKARRHGQLYFYATMIYLKYGKLPPRVHLDWLVTEADGDDTKLTGEINTYGVQITMTDVYEMMSRIKRAASEISAVYKLEMDKTLA